MFLSFNEQDVILLSNNKSRICLIFYSSDLRQPWLAEKSGRPISPAVTQAHSRAGKNGNSKSIFKESLNYVHSALEENVIENTNKQPKTNTVLQRTTWKSWLKKSCLNIRGDHIQIEDIDLLFFAVFAYDIMYLA